MRGEHPLRAAQVEQEVVHESDAWGHERASVRVHSPRRSHWSRAPTALRRCPIVRAARVLLAVRSPALRALLARRRRPAAAPSAACPRLARRHRRRAARRRRRRRVGPDGDQRRRVGARRGALERAAAVRERRRGAARQAGRFRDAGGVPTDFSGLDALVAAAAQRGLAVLPVVQATAGWAARRPGDATSPPRDPATFGRFLSALVERYGPRGSLWDERPELPRVPIRDWQVWNEPNITRYWSEQPFARSYVRAAAGRRTRALHAADPGATVVLAGLPNKSWKALRSIYRAGGRGHFDAVALHPYTGKPADVLRLVRYARRVMRAHGDARMPIWVTELSWPAAEGKLPQPSAVRRHRRGPGAPAGARRWTLLVRRPQAAPDRARVLVHVALGRGRAERVRLVGPAAAARRDRGRRPGAGRRSAAGRAGSRAARRPRTPGAAPDRAPRRDRGSRAQRSTQRASTASTRARGRIPAEAGARGAARPRAGARARRVGEQRQQRVAQRLGFGRHEARGAAARLGQRRRVGRDDRACRQAIASSTGRPKPS